MNIVTFSIKGKKAIKTNLVKVSHLRIANFSMLEAIAFFALWTMPLYLVSVGKWLLFSEYNLNAPITEDKKCAVFHDILEK